MIIVASFRSSNQALIIIIIYIWFLSIKLSHLTHLEHFFLNDTLYNHTHLQGRGISLQGPGPLLAPPSLRHCAACSSDLKRAFETASRENRCYLWYCWGILLTWWDYGFEFWVWFIYNFWFLPTWPSSIMLFMVVLLANLEPWFGKY